MVVMAMANGDRIQRLVFDRVVERKAGAPLSFWMGAGVHKQAIAFQVQEPGAGPNGRIRIEINYPHVSQ